MMTTQIDTSIILPCPLPSHYQERTNFKHITIRDVLSTQYTHYWYKLKGFCAQHTNTYEQIVRTVKLYERGTESNHYSLLLHLLRCPHKGYIIVFEHGK